MIKLVALQRLHDRGCSITEKARIKDSNNSYNNISLFTVG